MIFNHYGGTNVIVQNRDFATNPVTFREAALSFIEDLQSKKLSLNTRSSYRNISEQLIAAFGDTDIAKIRNGRVRGFVTELRNRRLSPATIRLHLTVLQLILRSVRNQDGEKLFPVTFDAEFIEAPEIDRSEQKTPAASVSDVHRAINAGGDAATLAVFLAATGLRISEALSLRVGSAANSDVYDPQHAIIRIRKTLKTKSARRDVFLTDEVNAWLRSRIAGDKVFNFCRMSAHTKLQSAGIQGAHSLRRLRITHLRKSGVNESVLRYQAGHSAGSDVTSRYDRTATDETFCRAEIERAGLGFNLEAANAAN
jgi:integrase